MALIKVLIIFVVILALLNKRLPLYLAMIFGSLLMIVMFRLPIARHGGADGAAHAHGLGRLVGEPCDVRDLGACLRA